MLPGFEPPKMWLDANRAWLERARDRWSARTEHVRPMRIRAILDGPVAWDGRTLIQIDGALQDVIVMRETGRTGDDVYETAGSGFCSPTIPIAHVECGDVTISRASAGVASPGIDHARRRRSRVRADAMGAGQIVVGHGWAKSTDIPIPTRVMPWLDFFVVGDAERIDDLLRDVSGLGRASGRGYGAVARWELSEMREDRSLTYNARPMRPIPIDAASDFDASTYEMREHGTIAPFWHRASRRHCAVPVPGALMEAA